MSNIQIASRPMPKIARVAPAPRESQYKARLDALRAGTDDCITEEVDVTADPKAVEKGKARLTSAVAQHRKTTGSTEKFAVRSYEGEDEDAGKVFVGVWKLEGHVVPKAKKVPFTAEDQQNLPVDQPQGD